ncbi:hypothetical protein DDE73_16625 [Bacillus thuringiensis]|uniref:Uncharacterized protein n=1 Tax=Bacillus cereus TaxID=1396 RepID=A0A9X6ZYQ8_BACCE|nr:hypothetical protein COI98_16890 [Bacillus cereus]QFQ26335.1 hypothetical protein DDE73_16625 [Bacillus thuringiensis]
MIGSPYFFIYKDETKLPTCVPIGRHTGDTPGFSTFAEVHLTENACLLSGLSNTKSANSQDSSSIW